MEGNQTGTFREGLLYGLAAYGWWGLVPVYFKAVAALPAVEVLAQRIVWSLGFLALLLTWGGRWKEVAGCWRDRRLLLMLLGSTVLIALNWFAFIHGVSTGQILQTSLGYFMLPLVSVVLGMVFYRERLRPFQLLAVTLGAVGVLTLTVTRGQWPWIALTLAVSFGFYGLLRKKAHVDGLVGLSVEVILLFPVATGYLAWLGATGELALGTYGAGMDVLLLLSGVVTAVPLLCFGQAARRLPLTTLGFLQYLSPTLALVLAVVFFGEPFAEREALSFGCIWVGLAVYSADVFTALRRVEVAVAPPAQDV